MPTALAAGRYGAAQVFQGVRGRFEAADAGLQEAPQLVLVAEAATEPTAGGTATAVVVTVTVVTTAPGGRTGRDRAG